MAENQAFAELPGGFSANRGTFKILAAVHDSSSQTTLDSATTSQHPYEKVSQRRG